MAHFLKHATLITALVFSSTAFAKTRNCNAEEKATANQYLLKIENTPALKQSYLTEHLPLGTPSRIGNEELLVNGGYIMNYDPDLRTATWTAYHLSQTDRTNASGKDRVNCFREDPRIENNGPDLNDYKEPIYDRGHMANDADLKDEFIEQLNSYVMTNMSPQHCRFNRGIWLSFENLVRKWAEKYDSIYVISGATFDRNNDGLRDIDSVSTKMASSNGEAHVSVPNAYYKIIYRVEGESVKAIAFLLENTNDKNGTKWADIGPKIEKKVIPLATIEQLTGTSFFNETSVTEKLTDWSFSAGGGNMEYTCR